MVSSSRASNCQITQKWNYAVSGLDLCLPASNAINCGGVENPLAEPMMIDRRYRSGLVHVIRKGSSAMASITETAEKFFGACEAGKGWPGCQAYCHPGATFAVQAEALADVTTLEQYAEWMKGLLTLLPDAGYDLKAFATDESRQIVCAFATFAGTHTGEGGPVPPTGKRAQT